MPASFPRIDLPSAQALDDVLAAVLAHSHTLLSQQLEADGLTGEQEEAVCRRVLDQWIQDAKARLKSNVSVQGVAWKEWEGKSQALAPLDAQLANRLSNLSQTVDELTEDAVLQRRELPLRRAEAIKAREEVLDSLREKEDEQRLRIRKAGWSKDREGPPPQLTIERQDEVRKSLSAALAQADSLAENLPAQVEALREQHDLVTQLRSMPP
ncbi:unnamed protein product [Jaminaea pallidilutea]